MFAIMMKVAVLISHFRMEYFGWPSERNVVKQKTHCWLR